MVDAADLADVLGRLERAFRRARPDEVSRLRPPLSADHIAELSGTLLPYRLPTDLVQIYRWHNGFDEWHDDAGYLTLFMDAPFPSLESAVAEREQLLRFAEELGDPAYWCPAWFPAFGDGQFGELVTLPPRTSPRSALLWSYHSQDSGLQAQYDSVLHLVDTTSRLWELDLLPWSNDDPSKHRRRLATVAAANPDCFDGQTEWSHRRYESSRFLDDTWLQEWRAAIGYEDPDGPLPDPVPIGSLDVSSLTEPAPIVGRMRGLAGGGDWQNVEVSDETGRVTVHLSRTATKNYIATNLGDRHLFWITPPAHESQPNKQPTDEASELARRVSSRIAAEVVAIEIRPIYDQPRST